MRAKGTFQIPSIDMEASIAVISRKISEATILAGQKWIIVSLNEIPVYTGDSWATFLHLASQLHFSYTISPTATPAEIAYEDARRPSASSVGAYHADPNNGKFTFTYKTDLKHLVINEYLDATAWGFNLKKPGPYNFQEKAEEAFFEVASKVFLPAPIYATIGFNV